MPVVPAVGRSWGCAADRPRVRTTRTSTQPFAPLLLADPDADLFTEPDEWHLEYHWLSDELFEPRVITEPRSAESQIQKACGFPIDERRHAELLREASQFTR